jgi:hypothetical protein
MRARGVKIMEILICLIFSHTELAKLVLDKCSTANLPEWTYEYEYEFVEDFQNLYSKSERSTFGSTGSYTEMYISLLLIPICKVMMKFKLVQGQDLWLIMNQ